jgi:RNA polymerase sigma-70 factor (ECF subfamily)
MPGVPPSPEPPPGGAFGTTSWSLVFSAAQDSDSGAALDRLCRRYWRPIYVFIRRSGLNPHDAEDATQDFFAYILDRSWLKESRPERGSFRGLVHALLRNFLANRRRGAAAQKRGGLAVFLPAELSELDRLATQELDPSTAYERVWATCVVQSALRHLADEQQRGGHAARFEALRVHLTRPPTTADYDHLVETLGEPRNRITVYFHRLSRRYGELIRAEIADTVTDRTEVEAELRRLVQVLSHQAA